MTDSAPPVGLFLPVHATESIALAGHDGEFVAALEHALRGHRRAMTLYGTERIADVSAIAPTLAGAVLLGFRDEEIASLPAVGVPVVTIDSYAHRSDFAVVRTDDVDGGARAAAYLAMWGHRDVLFVGPPMSVSGVINERLTGFTEALAERGCVCVIQETAGTTRREGFAVGRALGQRHPEVTAVFATADTLAIGVMDGLALSGTLVPDDVSVMGFDDLGLASIATPKLSSVAQDIARKARLTADALLLGSGSDVYIVGVDIVERASVQRPRAQPASTRSSS